MIFGFHSIAVFRPDLHLAYIHRRKIE